ncbi:ATP-dependent helicase HrpA [Williamsia serinedens]|uniref:ATP-dependent helicase HrpA n=2 Tax=Williamsia serinedens TaxID=391736 RepID=A0ABT1GVS1_9NOCA|nr:ATP-dependent helicase HrpA [Williamsia serinedens]
MPAAASDGATDHYPGQAMSDESPRPARRPRRRRGGSRRPSDQASAHPPVATVPIPDDDVTIADAHRLHQRARRVRSQEDAAAFESAVARATQRLSRRRELVPTLDYPADLPVSAARDEIREAIAAHQVVVIAGETGSGKTTQLPKICLELGRGVRGAIGHTQPRRIAARSVATRIAEETHTDLGAAVGFSVRFDDRSGADTLVKVMTDGILLAEIARDRLLRAYDTIIVDEAHERSLNIDFILGFLKQLLPRRPDLKVIITSATIDPGRFADHFATDDAPVPVISVSGRTYPVEVRYRPLVRDSDEQGDHEDLDAIGGIAAAVTELRREGPGDILVFLATEREIRDTADSLRRSHPDEEILPLFSRLSTADQNRVFSRSSGRRIVLSTNVAETSLTVPGIRYVIDAGTARISRYSTRTKVQRLPVEPISQASARQRSGRCGRVADGIAIRLYSEDDFEARPAFTDPEILRTNLASVILTMAALDLGDVARFPFVDPPDPRAIRDGVGLLEELGALRGRGDDRELTPVGRDIASLPIEPRWARMVVAAHKQGVLYEVLVVVAALSLPDVRERPTEHRQAADEMHARFAVPGSDFLSILALWRHLEEQRRALSGNQFRRQCAREFLHWLRIREWRDLVGQLERIVVDKGWTVTRPTDDSPDPDAAAIHQSVLAGLLGQIGVREGDTREFLGARGTKFVVFPGSGLARKPPRFVMAAEIVETSRLFARTVAGIEPEWAERLAGDLAKRQYSEPHWSSKRGSAMAYERVTLYGVPLVARRAVPYGRIDPEASRDLFLRRALVEGEWRTQHAFFAHNRALLEEARELEDRARRGDLVISDDQLYDFYDARIPADVVSGAHFDTWWKKARRTRPDLLDLTPEDVADTSTVSAGQFPDVWQQGEARLRLVYRFSPGSTHDGITVLIPLALLPRIRPAGFDWLVPGLRDDLAVALIRTLPKSIRRRLGPAADVGPQAMAALTPRSEPVVTGLAREVTRLTGVSVGADDFDPSALPAHLVLRFAAVDDAGDVVAEADSLAALTAAVHGSTRTASRAAPRAEARPAAPVVTSWTASTIGTLQSQVTETVAGQTVTSHPALRVVDGGVSVVLETTAAAARASTHRAVLRLLELSVPPLKASAASALPMEQRLALSQSPYASVEALLADCTRAAIVEAAGDTGDVRDPETFAALRARVAAVAGQQGRAILGTVADALTRLPAVHAELARLGESRATADVRDQLSQLVYAGFVGDTPAAQRPRLVAYLDAVVVRLQRLPAAASTDARGIDAVDRVVEHWAQVVARCAPARRAAVNDRAHWLIEELRVGLFAERVGTPFPVSEKRVLRAIDALAA